VGVTDNRRVKAIRAVFEVIKVNASPYIRWRGTREGYGSKSK